ncbi:MAG: redoxin family protein [Phycisphaeraceae bacterium]|nr:redoxin family protein [Phycisphaeraceae bacterium]MCW5755250.1 redoxin family protein [Phycisphaeraceae bacterium]
MQRLVLAAFLGLSPVVNSATVAQPANAPGQRLAVGAQAPAFQPQTWVKGAPVTRFEPGMVYVVEFWATWCGPCVAVIPHLTELQKTHGTDKLTVIGVASADQRMGLSDVESFVERQGAKMDYRVAFTPQRKIWTDWMTAAGRSGIPSSFVVDGEGRISFIGHPASGLDAAVERAIASTGRSSPGAGGGDSTAKLDPREERRRAMIQARVQEFAKEAEEYIKQEQYPRAIATIDRILALDGEGQYAWAGRKLELMVLSSRNERPVTAYAKKMVEKDYAEHPRGLAQVSAAIQRLEKREQRPDVSKELRDLASANVKKASEMTRQGDPEIEEILAGDLWMRGDKRAAAEAQKRAVEATKDDQVKREARMKKLDEYLRG